MRIKRCKLDGSSKVVGSMSNLWQLCCLREKTKWRILGADVEASKHFSIAEGMLAVAHGPLIKPDKVSDSNALPCYSLTVGVCNTSELA